MRVRTTNPTTMAPPRIINPAINSIARLISFLWTVALAVSVVWNMRLQDSQVFQIAAIQAAAFIEKDLALRSWAASHGGVYVRPTEQTPPNPYLDVPDRDVTTTDGMALTLMNPAYITREVHSRFAEKFGVYGHMTSLILKNPANAPDAWEQVGLERFAAGDLRDYVGVYDRAGQPFLRLMKPMVMEQDCLKCHAWTGIPLGGVRGGINASVPLDPLRQAAADAQWQIALSHLGFWLLGLAGITWVARRARHLHRERAQSEAERQDLYRKATHDVLTGLFNRRYLEEVCPRELQRARRLGTDLAVALMDIDHFKHFNDEYGHGAGDEVLRSLGVILRGFLRQTDIACRYGGEEFCIIMPDTSAGDMLPRMEALCQLIRSARIEDRHGHVLPRVTVSIGVAAAGMDGCDADKLLAEADRALYRAKEEGRSRVACLQ